MFLKLDVYCTWSYIIIFLELKKVDKNVMVCFKPEYIEDITQWHKDMNFIFEWQNNILRTSASGGQLPKLRHR